jgi:hypothetical protein
MRRELVVAMLFGCSSSSEDDRTKQEVDQPAEVGPPTVEDPCDPGEEAVDATGLAAVPMPNNALGRALTVSLEAEAGAVVTCTLDAAPPVWRQFLALDGTWRWTDQDPGAEFSEPLFDDARWAINRSPFAHNEDGATDISPLIYTPPAQVWFRTTFEVTDPSLVRSLAADVRRDDGVVIWLNGAEIVRDNVPAKIRVAGDEERTLFPFDLDPALLVPGTNTLAATLYQADTSTDAGFAVRLVAEVDELLPETHVLRSDARSTAHTLSLRGLLEDATYTCEARSESCGGATATTVVRTEPLATSVRLAAPPGLEGTGYILFNHGRPCAGERSNRLFIADPEGRIRWASELPVVGASSIDIESQFLPDGTIAWGGGEEPEGKPQILNLDGETVYAASYPGVDDDVYHHDVEVLPNGRILGIVRSDVVDGADEWAGFGLVEHDPATGEITWRWESQEAYDRGELAPPEAGEYDPWHANSLAWVDDAEGEGVYVSLFDRSEIVRVDRTTGSITWHLGLGRDFALSDGDTWFDRIHAIDVFPGPNGDRLFMYDNGTWSVGRSRAVAFELDVAAKQATVAWEWTEPTWFEPNWGDADLTDHGTVLIDMAHAWCIGGSLDHPGALVEIDETSLEVVSRLDVVDPDDSSYRAQHIDACAIFANSRYCP